MTERSIADRLEAGLRAGANESAVARVVFESAVRRAVMMLRRQDAALRAIADMYSDDRTDHAQLAALCIATAQVALKRGEQR